MRLTSKQINKIIGVDEIYKAHDILYKKLFNKEEREKMFRQFLDIEWDMSFDWFNEYFQDEQADRKNLSQDFSPESVTTLLSEIVGSSNSAMDICGGTGSIIIKKWDKDRRDVSPFEYQPCNYFYQVEEYSDRALPYLLFNLMIRGMNATVFHGDAITRECKNVYFIQNDKNDMLHFSSLNVMPQNDIVKREFNVKEWIHEPIEHIESPNPFEDMSDEQMEELENRMCEFGRENL